MRHCILASAVLAAALICSPLALAATVQTTPTTTAKTRTADGHWGHHHRHAMQHRHRGHLSQLPLRKLNLTEAQHTTIRQWIKQNVAASRSARRALRKQRKALATATPGTAAYQNATKALASSAASAASARVHRQAALRANIYQQLTPAQRSKLATLRAQRKVHMERWHKTHRPGWHTMPATATSAAAH